MVVVQQVVLLEVTVGQVLVVGLLLVLQVMPQFSTEINKKQYFWPLSSCHNVLPLLHLHLILLHLHLILL